MNVGDPTTYLYNNTFRSTLLCGPEDDPPRVETCSPSMSIWITIKDRCVWLKWSIILFTLYFNEPQDSLPYSQKHATGRDPEPNDPIHTLRSYFFKSHPSIFLPSSKWSLAVSFPTKTPYAFLLRPTRDTKYQSLQAHQLALHRQRRAHCWLHPVMATQRPKSQHKFRTLEAGFSEYLVYCEITW